MNLATTTVTFKVTALTLCHRLRYWGMMPERSWHRADNKEVEEPSQVELRTKNPDQNDAGVANIVDVIIGHGVTSRRSIAGRCYGGDDDQYQMIMSMPARQP